jgi:hypothetical protein
MPYTKYLLKRGSLFLISKLYFKSLSKLPFFLSAEFVIWFNLQLYKKVSILIFIILSVLTKVGVFISKKKTGYSFYIKVNLEFIFNLINIYLSNVDITLNSLLLNNGHNILEVFLSYNKMPIIPELDSFFEHVMNLLVYLEDKIVSLKLYINASTLVGAETFLRQLKLPVFLTK